MPSFKHFTNEQLNLYQNVKRSNGEAIKMSTAMELIGVIEDLNDMLESSADEVTDLIRLNCILTDGNEYLQSVIGRIRAVLNG